jgi:hypothetical protein
LRTHAASSWTMPLKKRYEEFTAEEKARFNEL